MKIKKVSIGDEAFYPVTIAEAVKDNSFVTSSGIAMTQAEINSDFGSRITTLESNSTGSTGGSYSLSSNTTTSALILSKDGTAQDTVTLGSAAFSSSDDFATKVHEHTKIGAGREFHFNSYTIGEFPSTHTIDNAYFYTNGVVFPCADPSGGDVYGDAFFRSIMKNDDGPTIAELAVVDDSGSSDFGYQIQFNYYSTNTIIAGSTAASTATTTPTYSIVVPQKSGTIVVSGNGTTVTSPVISIVSSLPSDAANHTDTLYFVTGS